MGKKIDLCFLVSLTSMPRWKCTRRYDLSRSVNRPSLKAEKIKYKLIFLHCYFCIRHMHEIQDTLLFRTNLGKKNTPIPFKVLYRWFASYGFKTMEVVYLCRNLELQNKKKYVFYVHLIIQILFLKHVYTTPTCIVLGNFSISSIQVCVSQ